METANIKVKLCQRPYSKTSLPALKNIAARSKKNIGMARSVTGAIRVKNSVNIKIVKEKSIFS